MSADNALNVAGIGLELLAVVIALAASPASQRVRDGMVKLFNRLRYEPNGLTLRMIQDERTGALGLLGRFLPKTEEELQTRLALLGALFGVGLVLQLIAALLP